MNPGTEGGGSETSVGPRCVFLANAHVAHDCRLGEGVILSNNVMLAGHCQIGDFAILSGGVGGAPVRAHRRACLRRRPRRRRARHHSRSAWRSAIAPRSPGSISSASSGAAFRTRRSTSSGAPTGCCSTGKGTLKERVGDVAEAFPDQEAVQQIVAFLRQGGDRAICVPARRQGRRGVNGPAAARRGAAAAPLAILCGVGRLSARGRRRGAPGRARAVPDRRRRFDRRSRSRPFRMSGCGWARSASCSPR